MHDSAEAARLDLRTSFLNNKNRVKFNTHETLNGGLNEEEERVFKMLGHTMENVEMEDGMQKASTHSKGTHTQVNDMESDIQGIFSPQSWRSPLLNPYA